MFELQKMPPENNQTYILVLPLQHISYKLFSCFSCVGFCNPMDCSTGLPILHYLLEFV